MIIPESVYEEIMHKNGTLESIALNQAIKEKWISVQRVALMANLETKNIGQGEKEAISLAHKHKSLLVIDDDSAKKYGGLWKNHFFDKSDFFLICRLIDLSSLKRKHCRRIKVEKFVENEFVKVLIT